MSQIRRIKTNEKIRRQAASPLLVNITEGIKAMAVVKEPKKPSLNSLLRSCLFLNQANPELYIKKPMVVNSVDAGAIKARNEVTPLKIPTDESAKMETKKILTQEITLTSKAPLKILELLESSAIDGTIDDCLISECCKYLKKKGKDLDNGPNTVALNHYFDTMRGLSRNTSINLESRKKLLEIIEFRARNWRTTEEHEAYYAKKSDTFDSKSRDSQPASVNLSTSTSSPAITGGTNIIKYLVKEFSPESTEAHMSPSSSGEVIKHSGKFQRPVKVPGKNFLKDEFIIKNCDSGKVNPGAKDRLLQITGPDESSINKAKYYIGDTIKRNASPIPCDQHQSSHPQTQNHHQTHQQLVPLNQSRQLCSSSTPTVHKFLEKERAPFVQTIAVGDEVLIISSSTPILTEEAKVVLEHHFQRSQASFAHRSCEDSDSEDSELSANPLKNGKSNGDNGISTNHVSQPAESTRNYQKSASHGSLSTSNSFFSKPAKDAPNNSKKIVYDREFLLKCANSELSKVQPNAIKLVTKQIPDIARKPRQARANSVESAVA